MSKQSRLYVDSCCFIELVKFKLRKPLGHDEPSRLDREHDCWYLRRLCDASRDGAIQLFTSTITVAECTHIGEEEPPSAEVRHLMIDFLTSGTVVELVEPDIFVAEHARNLRWEHDIRLAGADALHFSSAIISECSEFLTWDQRIKKQKIAAAIPKLKKLGLKVSVPSSTQGLPTDYRQGNFYEE